MVELNTTLVDKSGRPFVVRSYRAGDRPALEAMYVDFQPKRIAQGLPPERELRLRRWLSAVLDRGIHLVVDVDGQLIGHAMLVDLDDQEGVELANFLHQSVRGRGIGTELNRVAAQHAREYGIGRIWLSVEPSNRAAVRSYGKAGFRRLPASPWAPEIEMELRL